MAYRITDQLVGAQPIATTETAATANHPLGTIVRAVDPTYGEGEFIYLTGVASTILGSVVTYSLSGGTYQSKLATSVVGLSDPIAVAMSANVAGDFGWYQISGVALAGKANTLSLTTAVPLAVASGLMIAADTTNRIGGCVTAVVASASTLVITVPVMINRPTTGGGEA